mmetsp:Transcript_21912/g.36211  ORF Transcript_21912/g.36211 Transcript_21912/m.36211 type:complete len:403 (+) Transcript_21912:489-1697(+)
MRLEATAPHKGGLCSAETSKIKLERLKADLEGDTNVIMVRSQYEHTRLFYDALTKDTALYGTADYGCDNAPFNKEGFRASDGYGKQSGLKFFPGYCNSAQELALVEARSATCPRTVCRGGEVITGATAENGDVTVDKWGSVGNWIIGGGNKVDTEDPTVKLEHGYREFCGDEIVPCPDYTQADALEMLLEDANLEQYKFAEDLVLESAIPNLVVDASSENAIRIFNNLLTQIEIAGFVYVVYQCISLFFPSPLFIFRSPYEIAIKRFFFGSNKYIFVAIVLAIWWGWSYFKTVNVAALYEVYVYRFLKDPCVADAGHFLQVGRVVSETCGELLELESNWTVNAQTINTTLTLSRLMEDCGCSKFPFVNLPGLMPVHIEELRSIGFGTMSDYICEDSDVTTCK